MAKETKSRVVFQHSALGTRIALLVMLCVCIAAMAVAGLAIHTAKRDTAALRQQALDLEKRNEQLEEYLSLGGQVCICNACLLHNGFAPQDMDPRFELIDAPSVVTLLMGAKSSLQLT